MSGKGIAVIGSVAFDTIETAAGRADRELGGAATHFAVSASFFAPVHIIAPVGDDFPAAERAYLTGRGIDCAGLVARPGKTFYWHGRYHEDMNVRDTLQLDLGVFGDFDPVVPPALRDVPYVFLGVVHPDQQAAMVPQFTGPRLVGLDTMTHWINEARGGLDRVLRHVDLFVLNDEEARVLSGEKNVTLAARRILTMGPKRVLIKRGEYGAILFSGDTVFAVPAFPLEQVFDPTGAGDTFAGGLMGHLAQTGDLSEKNLRKAIVYGSVMASFIVEDFGGRRMRTLTMDDIERRYRQFVALTEF